MKNNPIQKSCHMKTIIPTFVIFAMFALLGEKAFSQNPTGTVTVLHQPCNNDGAIVATITSGMTPPLTFHYDNGITHANINALIDTLNGISWCYSVYVTDTFQHYIYLNSGIIQPFSIDNPVVSNPICPATVGSVQITINQGVMPDSVHWFVSNFPNPNFGPYVGTGNPMNLAVGQYMMVVTDSNGCTITLDSNSILVQSISNVDFTLSSTNASCTNGTATVSNITGGMPPFTYQWSNGANTSYINNLSQGSYNVTVTDSQGCSKTKYAYISQTLYITVHKSVTNATCLQNNGSAIVWGSGGASPYTYIWSNGAVGSTVSGLTGGTSYTITATDINGCWGTGYVYVGFSTPINVTYNVIPASCNNTTGSATLNITGGTLPYTVTWYTYPQQNGTTIANMPSGTYHFKVVDAVGCKRTGAVNIQPQSYITAIAYSTNAVCPNGTGSVHVNVSGSNPPFTYLWNTGATTQMITNAGIGAYYCTITDSLGCHVTKYTTLNMVATMNVGISSTPASCRFVNDGVLYANATGGTAPYTYHWSNGQTGQSATGLAPGYYYVHVEDANGCIVTHGSNVGYNAGNDSCYCTITGNVYVDLNTNCIHDPGEQGIDHIMIHCSGMGYTFTDVNGDYSFIVPTGNYTISEIVQNIYPLAPCQVNATVVNATAGTGCVITVNFANVVNPLHDIHIISCNGNHPVPGFQYNQGIIVKNDGTNTESNIIFGYRHDGQLQYLNSTPVAFTQLSPGTYPNWYSITSAFPSLIPGASVMLYANYQVPPNIPLATTVDFFDTTAYMAPMGNWLTDYTPWNNVNSFQAITCSSFDPNFKEVSPIGEGPEGYISTNDSVLDYVIHFQNTGNDNAQKVVIIDTLDTDLAWTSLRPGYSTHNYTAEMSENGILKFTFNNINLPYQSQSEMGSRGLVAYSIKQHPHLSLGTRITNSADIYFDYNAPVITNTTLNTINATVGNNEIKSVHTLKVWPDPATSEILIDMTGTGIAGSVCIYDITGRLLKNEALQQRSVQKMQIDDLECGIYLISVLAGNGDRFTARFIKN
jgi:uncharacterized repeat protein (TIGR01451 family)